MNFFYFLRVCFAFAVASVAEILGDGVGDGVIAWLTKFVG